MSSFTIVISPQMLDAFDANIAAAHRQRRDEITSPYAFRDFASKVKVSLSMPFLGAGRLGCHYAIDARRMISPPMTF